MSFQLMMNYFFIILIKCDKGYRTVVLGYVAGAPLYIGIIVARLRSYGISPVFSKTFYSSWRG